jgi:hypothetical protein
VKFLKIICLTPELVTELFCPTPKSRGNLNVNGAVEKIYDFVFECMGIQHFK